MVNFMAKVKYNTAQFLQGILDKNSGTLQMLRFNKRGVVQLIDESIPVKRPNQYSTKMQ
jgi:hypothetical protein